MLMDTPKVTQLSYELSPYLWDLSPVLWAQFLRVWLAPEFNGNMHWSGFAGSSQEPVPQLLFLKDPEIRLLSFFHLKPLSSPSSTQSKSQSHHDSLQSPTGSGSGYYLSEHVRYLPVALALSAHGWHILLQGLCTYCSLILEHFSSRFPHSSFHFLQVCTNVTFSRQPSLENLFKLATPIPQDSLLNFTHSTHHLLTYPIIYLFILLLPLSCN